MEPTNESSDKSVHYYKKKSNSYSSQAEAMSFFEEGNFSMNNGDYGTAIENYKRCLENADEDKFKMMVYFGLGNACTLSDNWEEGLNSFNHCLKFSSEVESEYFEHQVYLGLGSVHSTIKRLEEAMKKDEMECLCHIALGGLNKSLGYYEKSLEHYRKGFSFIDYEHQEAEMQSRRRKENQQGNQQEQNKRRERPRRPRKVGGINVGKDFVKHNLKSLSVVTSAGIVSGVLAVSWELAELFDKLEQYREAADIYEMYLEIVKEDGDIEKQTNVMKRLKQIYYEDERHYLMDSITTKLQEIEERKKNQELQLREWKYNDKSTKHKELFLKLIEYGKDPNVEVKHVDDVRVVFSEQFLLGRGSDGTRVYLGLGKDGYGKAVKQILRDNTYLAQKEEEIFNEINAKKSDYVVNYYCSRQDTGTDYVHLILDLCEESLEYFVLSESNSLDYLQKCLPDIFKQILNGLVDLHSDPRPILHRDLKPSNVLRDTQGKFLIADFGISRILKDSQTYKSEANRGTPHWIAPESYIVDKNFLDKARYKPESDVMNAGMVAYFVATKGKHPFGTKECILKNLLNGKPVGLKEISNFELKDLLSWMLQLKPEHRPSAKEALKHPYLLSDEEKFDLLCEVGNQPEIKIQHLDHLLCSDVYEGIIGLENWMNRLIPEFDDHFNKKFYDSTWLGCLRFIQNVDQHWHDEHHTKLSPYIKEGNYKEYFVRVLPELPLLVHRIIRLNEWILRPDMEKRIPTLRYALEDDDDDDDDEDIVSSVRRTDRYSFHFKHSKSISLSSDKRTAERQCQFLMPGNGIVFSDQPLRDNEVFEVSVDKLVPALFGRSDITLDIGVTSLNPSYMNLPQTMTDLTTGTWMLSGDQVVRNKVIIKRRYCQDLNTLSVGDRIGVCKTENGSLHFFINGKHQGLAASSLPQDVFAVVDLYAKCTKVSIVSPGGPTTLPYSHALEGPSLNSGTSYQQAERPRPIPKPRTNTSPATTTCNYRKQCESFLETLNISDNFFDKTPEYNKCFCDNCHQARGDKECYTRGNPPKTYALPLGWSRFAVKVGPQGKALNIFNNWHVAFHGTQAKYLQPIFNNDLQLLMPGDVAFGGSTLREGEGHYNDSWKPRGFDTKQIFVSPSVKYAGCAVYSKKKRFTDPKTRKRSIAQVALQVLIRPGSYKVGRTTVGNKQQFDPNFSDDELEWSTKERPAIIVTGLLIKISNDSSEQSYSGDQTWSQQSKTLSLFG
ncbi:uncharacterized protein LOC124439800 [Xenia sp. Carnegie-2017]|uniref:uncharacterized protein LOC124439800 n=1 Tax=Xenia sp. Carnegie-2017 TaxID=2897299 RepID=UPI001F03DE94|nr:uncharacterized protein LOC124439800 [Xenia sp. Carnegie-2017]